MSVALAVHFTVKGGAAWLRVFAATGEIDLGPGDPEHNVVKQLKTLDTMWTYLLTMTTFVNSFFLSQAYGLWLATKVNSRKWAGVCSQRWESRYSVRCQLAHCAPAVAASASRRVARRRIAVERVDGVVRCWHVTRRWRDRCCLFCAADSCGAVSLRAPSATNANLAMCRSRSAKQ